MLDGVELLCDVDASTDDDWLAHFIVGKFNLEELRAKLSEEFAIPKWAFSFSMEPTIPSNVKFFIPQGKNLLPQRLLQAPAS
jgi:hypothetical protein